MTDYTAIFEVSYPEGTAAQKNDVQAHGGAFTVRGALTVHGPERTYAEIEAVALSALRAAFPKKSVKIQAITLDEQGCTRGG